LHSCNAFCSTLKLYRFVIKHSLDWKTFWAATEKMKWLLKGRSVAIPASEWRNSETKSFVQCLCHSTSSLPNSGHKMSFTYISLHTLSLNYHLYLMGHLKYSGHAEDSADKQERVHKSALFMCYLFHFFFFLFPYFLPR